MTASTPDSWEGVTFDGARRAMLRQNLRLSVRERLALTQSMIDAGSRVHEAAGRQGLRPPTNEGSRRRPHGV